MQDLPVVILCGGQGTRMRGQTLTKKELIKVGGRPIIWHVMRIFSAHRFNRFVLTLGYQAEQLKRYFLEYDTLTRDLSVNLGDGEGQQVVSFIDDIQHSPWNVSLVYTGLKTEKASRIARIKSYLNTDRFFVAYGDDVSDIDLSKLLDFHMSHGKTATITAVRIRLPYGVVEADDSGLVAGFNERPLLDYWINGGFMLFEKRALRMMADGDNVNLEKDVLPKLADSGELMIFRHRGFWQSMNTMKDNMILEELWRQGAPWKVW